MYVGYTENISSKLARASVDDDILKILYELGESPESFNKAMRYINSTFRTFSEGLSEFIRQSPAYKETPAKSLPSFLYQKLCELDEPDAQYTQVTVRNWLNSSSLPKRKAAFQICFALHADYDDTCRFFCHVMYDRAFNCHNTDEAVYYYCIKRGLPYSAAVQIIRDVRERIKNLPEPDPESTAVYYITTAIQDRIDSYISSGADISDFIDYLVSNAPAFEKSNVSARAHLNSLISQIKGSDNESAALIIRKYRCSSAKNHTGAPKLCHEILPRKYDPTLGLIVPEYISQNLTDSDFELIANKNLHSDSFMFSRIFNLSISELKQASRFKNTLISGIINSSVLKINASDDFTDYSRIRRQLILLKFYSFWAMERLGYLEIPAESYFDTFVDETNLILTESGYGELYPGNPFDCFFMWASISYSKIHPLVSLRDMVNIIYDEDFI